MTPDEQRKQQIETLKAITDPYIRKIETVLGYPANALELVIYNEVSGKWDRDVIVSRQGMTNKTFSIKETARSYDITTFKMTQLPGCCGFVISYEAYVYSSGHRKLGVNTIAYALRKEIAKYAGYTAMISTSVPKYFQSHRAPEKNNAKTVWEIVNKRTSNQVVMQIVNL